MREAFGDLIQSDQLTVRGNEMWIEIELSSSLLFPRRRGDSEQPGVRYHREGRQNPGAVPESGQGRRFHRQSADPNRPVSDQLGAVFGARVEHRAYAGHGWCRPFTSGRSGLWRISAGGRQCHCRGAGAQPSGCAGDLPQPRHATWRWQCRDPAVRGWHATCTGVCVGGSTVVSRQIPVACRVRATAILGLSASCREDERR